MASILLSGVLKRPNGELAVGDQIKFEHKSSTGDTVQTAECFVTIPPNGQYSVSIEYGIVNISYKAVTDEVFTNLGKVTVNQDNPATNIPELLRATVPQTNQEMLEFQTVLANCIDAQNNAEQSANDAEQALSDIDALTGQQTTTELINSSAIYSADKVLETSGFIDAGDGGGAKWVQNGVTGQTPSQTPAQLGDALLNDANGNQWQYNGAISNTMLVGAIGSSADVSEQVEALAFSAIDKGDIIEIGDLNAQDETLKSLHKVTVKGVGSINRYKKPVVKPTDATYTPLSSTIRVNEHCSKILTSNKPKIVLVGDSISSFYSISLFDKTSDFENSLRKKLNNEFGVGNFDFVNLAIGGQRFFDLGKQAPVFTQPNAGYPWYNDFSKRWIDYIKDEKPDMIIMAFGMNDGPNWDSGNFPFTEFVNIFDDISSFSKRPDIIMCTPVLPSLSTSNADFYTFDEQEGRTAVAGFVRSWCEMQNFGLIDFNRTFLCYRDGVDPIDNNLDLVKVGVNLPLPYIHDKKCSEYSVVINISPSHINSGVTFNLSEKVNNFFNIKNDGSGYEITSFVETGLGKTHVHIDDIAPPSSDFDLEVRIRGSQLYVSVDQFTVIYDGSILRYGGDFTPKISCSVTDEVKLYFLEGVKNRYRPKLLDWDVYGIGGNLPPGGNGLNHMNSLGCISVFNETLDALSLTPSNVGRKNSSAIKYSDGVELDFIAKTATIKYQGQIEVKHIDDVLLFDVGSSIEYIKDGGIVVGAKFGQNVKASILLSSILDGVNTIDEWTIAAEANKPDTYTTTGFICSLGGAGANSFISLGFSGDYRARSLFFDDSGTLLTDLITSSSNELPSDGYSKICSSIDSSLASLDVTSLASRSNRLINTGNPPTSQAIDRLKIGWSTSTSSTEDVIIRNITVSFLSSAEKRGRTITGFN